MQDVDYPLADEVCVPVTGYVPANDTGITGNWAIEGRDGIDVSVEAVNGQTVVAFTSDMSWWTVEDPKAALKDANDGIWTINGLPGRVIRIDCDSGRMFPEVLEGGHINFRRILIVPSLVLFSDTPDGSSKTHYVFDPYESDTWENKWTGTAGTVEYDPDTMLFTIVMGNVTRTMKINETVVWKQFQASPESRLERLTIAWKGLDENDPFRKYIKTSAEEGSAFAYPLDDILTGSVSGGNEWIGDVDV